MTESPSMLIHATITITKAYVTSDGKTHFDLEAATKAERIITIGKVLQSYDGLYSKQMDTIAEAILNKWSELETVLTAQPTFIQEGTHEQVAS